MTTALPMGKSLREAFGEALADIGRREPRLVVLDGDLGSSTRADIFEEAHPDRFFQMGIAEQNLVGAAAGMATLGLIPWISTFACFAVARALDSVRVLVAQTELNVKIAGGYAGLLAGMTGKTHLMFNDIAVMRSLAGIVVVSPVDEFETRQAISVLTDTPGPAYIRLTRPNTPLIFDETYRFELGSAIVLREGDDVALISTGTQTARATEAADALAEEGISVYLVHVPTLKPLDDEAIATAAARTGHIITVEDHSIIGGLGGAITESLAARRPVWVDRLGIQDVYGESGPDDALLDKYGLSTDRVVDDVRRLVHARRAAS
jgi:transketolase